MSIAIADDYKYALMIYSAKSPILNQYSSENSMLRKLKYLGYSYLFIPKVIRSAKGLFNDLIELIKESKFIYENTLISNNELIKN
jgi:hypothetical protein